MKSFIPYALVVALFTAALGLATFSQTQTAQAQAVGVNWDYARISKLFEKKPVVAQNANYVVTFTTPAGITCGTVYTNTGAAAALQATLPVCTAKALGCFYDFTISAAFAETVITQSPDVVNAPALSQTTKTIITSPTTAGSTLHVECYAVGLWRGSTVGTWTSN